MSQQQFVCFDSRDSGQNFSVALPRVHISEQFSVLPSAATSFAAFSVGRSASFGWLVGVGFAADVVSAGVAPHPLLNTNPPITRIW